MVVNWPFSPRLSLSKRPFLKSGDEAKRSVLFSASFFFSFFFVGTPHPRLSVPPSSVEIPASSLKACSDLCTLHSAHKVWVLSLLSRPPVRLVTFIGSRRRRRRWAGVGQKSDGGYNNLFSSNKKAQQSPDDVFW